MADAARRVIRATALATLAVVACLLVVMALPPVQARLVREVAAGLGGVELQVGHLWATPLGIWIEDLRVEAPGLSAGIDDARVSFAFWASIARFRLDIEQATFDGVDVRVDGNPARPTGPSPSVPDSEGETRRIFTGLGRSAAVPRWLRLRELSAAGTAAMEGSAGAAVAGPWELNLQSIAAGTMGSVLLRTRLDVRRRGEAVASAAIDADADIVIDAGGRLTRLAVDGDVVPADERRSLHATATVAAMRDGERYALQLGSRTDRSLARIDAVLEPDGDVEADWDARLTPGAVTAFARGRSLPDLAGTSAGRLRFEQTGGLAQVQGSAEIEGRRWEALDPRLADLNALTISLDLAAQLAPGIVDAQNVRLKLSSDAEGDLLDLRSLQPLRLEAGSWLFQPETWGAPALSVRASSIPLRWLRHYGPGARRLEDGRLSGAVNIVRDAARRTRLVVTEPLRASGVALQPVQGISMPLFDVTLVPRASLREGSLQAEIEELTITAETGLSVVFRGRGGTSRNEWPVARFDGALTAEIPALQRIMPESDRLRATARLRFDFEALELQVLAADVGAVSSSGREIVAADLSGQRPLRITLPQLRADWDELEPQSVSLQLDGMPLDWLSPYVPEFELRGGEVSGRFRATGGLGRGLTLETDEPLTIENLQPLYRGRPVAGTMTATAVPRLTLGRAASSFALDDIEMRNAAGDRLGGRIHIDAPPGADTVAVELELEGDFPSLARRYDTRLGALRVHQRSELDPASRRVNVQALTVDMADRNGTTFLQARSLRPFFVGTEPFSVSVGGGSPEVVEVNVAPVRLERLVPGILGLEVEGLLPQGRFFGRAAADGGIVLAAEEPLVFRDVTLRWDEAVLLDRVTMSVRYEVAYSADGFEARFVDIGAAGVDGAEFARATTEAVAPLTGDRLLSRARLAVEANLAALARQPLLADAPPFTAGTIAGSVELVNAAGTTIAARAELRGAATAQSTELPDLDLRLDAAGVRGDHVRLMLPLRLRSHRFGRSDLRLEGALFRDAAGAYEVDAALTGARIAVGDVERLIHVLLPEPSGFLRETRRRAAEKLSAIVKLRTQRHSVPVWTQRLSGSAAVDIDSLVFPSFEVQGVRGELEVAPDAVTLTGVGASLLDAELEANVAVAFDASARRPYTLGFDAEIRDLELGRLFLAVAPDEAPTAEGRFDVSSTLTGSGVNPLHLAVSTLGQIRLVGRDGVFRGLAARAGTGSTAARTVGLLTFSNELRAVGRLLDRLGEIRFEEAEILLDRTQPDRIDVSNLLVRSPQLRLQATGSLSLAATQPLLLSPLDVSATLAARDDVAVLFDGMDLLEKEAGDAGYRRVSRTIEIGGTPAAPDTSDFWSLLEEGAEGARGSFRFALRALNRRMSKKRGEE